jgi:hypothetical protein
VALYWVILQEKLATERGFLCPTSAAQSTAHISFFSPRSFSHRQIFFCLTLLSIFQTLRIDFAPIKSFRPHSPATQLAGLPFHWHFQATPVNPSRPNLYHVTGISSEYNPRNHVQYLTSFPLSPVIANIIQKDCCTAL